MSLLSIAGATPSDEGFELKSCRFNNPSTSYLTFTPIVEGNKKTWTFSCWTKFATGVEVTLLGAGTSPNQLQYYVQTTGNLFFWMQPGPNVKPTAQLRDPSAWYHIVLAVDTTRATAADRVKFYVNGELLTDITTTNYPTQNQDTPVGDDIVHRIGVAPNGSSQPYDGYMAEAYMINGQQLDASPFAETNSKTNQWQPKNPTDIKQAVTFGTNGFYLPFSNDALATSFTDASRSPRTIARHAFTQVGGVDLQTAHKKFGTASAKFDGTDSYITTPDSNDWNFGTGNFTMECWVKFDVLSQHQVFFGSSTAGFAAYWYFYYQNSDTTIRFTDGVGGNFVIETVSLSVDTWYHIAYVRNNSNHYLWLDGVQVGSTNVDTDALTNVAAPLQMGALLTSGFMDGNIDEARISNTARYTAAFDVATAAFEPDEFTVLLMHFDGANGAQIFPDDGPHPLTAVGNTTNTRISDHPVTPNGDAHIIGPKVGSSAIAFDGTGDYLSAPDSADWTFGTGDFTLESWINTNALADYVIFSQWEDASNRWYLRVDARAAQQEIGFYHHGASTSIAVVGVWPALNQWVHMAFVRASGVIKIYVDGVSQTLSTNTNPSANLTDIAATLRIGDYNGGNNLNGYLDEIRISNSARYTDNFTPDTTEFSSDANTKLLIHSNTTMGSTTFIDSSGSPHTISANGDVKNVAPKIGTGMAAFDGSDSFSVAASFDWNIFGGLGYIPTQNTIECWVSLTNHSQAEHLFGNYEDNNNKWEITHDGAGTTSGLSFGLKAGGTWEIYSGYASGGAGAINDSDWHHVALVRDKTVYTLYLDGTALDNTVTDSYESNASVPLYIGQNGGGGSYLTGFMDEIRVSQILRYTSTFTPSTTAFKDDKDTTLLLHMDGGVGIDPSTNLPILPGQGTYAWDASTNAIFYDSEGLPTNKSFMNFDGTGDYLTIPVTTDFDWGTSQDFTVEGWAYLNTNNSNDGTFYACPLLTVAGGFRFAAWSVSSRHVFTVAISDGNTGWPVHPVPYMIFPVGKWTHWAATRVGNVWSLYQDGIFSATETATLDFDMGALVQQIGSVEAWSSDRELDGKLDQVRVSNTARYTYPTNQNTNSTASLVSGTIYSTNTVDKSNDGNPATQCQFNNAVATNSIKYDFGSGNEITATAIQFQWAQQEGVNWVKLEGSNNDSDYTQLFYDDGDNFPGGDTLLATMGFANSTAYRYYKFSAYNDGFDYPIYKEIRLFEKAFTPPTEPFTTDVNTKLLVQSDFSEGGLGADHSGNYNYFTPTNLTADDMMEDNPLNNFCTWNPVAYYPGITTGTLAGNTYSEGNLKVASTVGSGANWTPAIGTLSVSSGKWYWEYNFISNTGNSTAIVGVMNAFTVVYANPPTTTGYRASNGNKYIDWVVTSYGDILAAGDIIGLALDLDAETITFYRNNVSQGAISLGAQTKASGSLTPTIAMGDTSVWTANFGQDSSFAGAETAQGNQDANDKGDFYYAVPAGHLSLCTDNLPAPAIALPGEHFNTVLYTGNDADRTISGVGFQPDFLWVKERSSTSNHMLFDALRGTGTNRYRVNSNTTAIEITNDPDVTLVSDGFTVSTSDGGMNQNTETYVGWNWKAGTTFDPKTDGDIAVASGSKNVAAGFSIVAYTGESGSPTVGHGLPVAPDIIIIKNLDDTKEWNVTSPDNISTTSRLVLDTATAKTSGSGLVSPYINSTIFKLDNGTTRTNDGSSDYIAYCFSNIEGYSKVGVYEANGSSDGPFIYTGFTPAFLIIKAVDYNYGWLMSDDKRSTYNAVEKYLHAESNAVETVDASGNWDFVSNGFKLRDASYNNNHPAGNEFLYIAFAESPFKTSNAR